MKFLNDFVEKFVGTKSAPVGSKLIPVEQRERYLLVAKQLTLLFFTTAMLVILMRIAPFESLRDGVFKEKEIASRNIVASREFSIENPAATEQRRREASAVVARVFTLDDSPENELSTQLDGFFSVLRELGLREIAAKDAEQKRLNIAGGLLNGNNTVNETPARESKSLEISAEQRAIFASHYHLDLSPRDWDILLDTANWHGMRTEIVRVIEPILGQGIIATKRTLQTALAGAGAVLRHKSAAQSEIAEKAILSDETLLDVGEAVEAFEAGFSELGEIGEAGGVAKKIARMFVKPNVFFDAEETANRSKAVEAKVESVVEQVRRGEIIVRAGDVVSALQQKKLERHRDLGHSGQGLRPIFGYGFLASLILVTVYFFTASIWPTFHPTMRDLIMLSITLLGSFFLVRAHLVVSGALTLSFAEIDPSAFVIAAPVAAGGMLLQVTLGPASVFFFTTSFALLTDISFEGNWAPMLLIIMGNIVGAVSVKRCSRRSVFLIAGTRVALMNALIVFCHMLLADTVINTDVITWRLLFAITSGLVSGIFAAGLTPLAEYIGKYVTDIKLLELASLDRHLLRDLAMEAPGTWNHCIVMGQMAEAAAERIGANGLLARVGAYYHDIGKTRKPGYFTENQAGLENRHDKLTPSMSALIIKAHVKDGVEMAMEDRLPPQIVEFIPEHHGTSLIEYFFEKAKKEAPEGEVVDESHYRYPGPKPQSKESGILMLADGTEAAARSLADPSPAKIKGVVQKMINRVFASGQLDECGLTLRDLHLVAKSFTRVLSAIYHKRIEYSEPAEKVSEKVSENSSSAEQKSLEKKQAESKEGLTGTLEVISKKSGGRSVGEAASAKRAEGSGVTEKNGSGSNKEALKRLGM